MSILAWWPIILLVIAIFIGTIIWAKIKSFLKRKGILKYF